MSNGTGFGFSQHWSEFFAPTGETPLVADVNGDGRDDIVTFVRGSGADVWAALSNGSSFDAPRFWHDFFVAGSETPLVGDFSGDGKADIAAATLGSTNDVWVGTSAFEIDTLTSIERLQFTNQLIML